MKTTRPTFAAFNRLPDHLQERQVEPNLRLCFEEEALCARRPPRPPERAAQGEEAEMCIEKRNRASGVQGLTAAVARRIPHLLKHCRV